MPKKKKPEKSSKKSKAPKTSTLKLGKDTFVFRERRFNEINLLPKHPPRTPGYKSTLPGAPGWQYKEDPGT